MLSGIVVAVRRPVVMRAALMVLLGLAATGCAISPSGPDRTEPALKPEAVPEKAPVAPAAPAVTAPSEPAAAPPVVRQSLGLEEFSEANDEKLLQVYVGMWRPTVDRIMDGHQSGQWINPYKRQTIVGGDRRTYEVLFYLTRAPRSGQRVTERFLTPVIFRDVRVVAFGRYALKKLRRGDCLGRRDAAGRCP